jgi:hypothetical protein
MNSLARTIVGSAVTAAAVYFMDPVNGHQRRLMMQDRYKRAARRLDLGTRDLRHDASERTRTAFGRKSDKAVNKLVCGAVRHSVSDPATVAVAVDHGHVFLRGNVLPHEHQRVLDEVRRQPGVIVITDHLTEQRANGEYAVDGGRSFKVAARRSGWSTTGRVLAGCAGGALIFWGVRERKALGEFGVAVAEELQRALERNLREGFDTAKETVDAAEEGLAKTGRAAAKKVDEGLDWAEAASSEVVEEYAQRRRQPDAAESTH